MNSKCEFFKVQFSLSSFWHSGRCSVLQCITLLLLLGSVQPVLAAPTTPTGDFIDNQDGTVTHKITGLTWMRCAIGQTWTGSSCSGTADTYTYKQALALKHRFAGWRLPNIAELQTIVEREAINPAINTTVFPSTPGNMFWSSSPYVGNTSSAWYVNFNNGYVNHDFNNRSYSLPVRLVRASQSLAIGLSSPNEDFADNKDGTITHKRTGLMWQRCSVGQEWTGLTCSGTANIYTYDRQAIALTGSFAGYSDWRVPNANELASIVKYDAYRPAINTTVFPNTPGSAFGSSSPFWDVNFHNGLVFSYYHSVSSYIDYSFPVRLVRGSQSIAYWPSITVIKTGTGTGTVSSNPTGIICGTTCINGFSSGKKVTLSATPDADSLFVGWEGDCSGIQTSCTVTVNKGKYVTAVFESIQTLP